MSLYHRVQSYLTIELHANTIKTLDLSFCYTYAQDEIVKELVKWCPKITTCILWACHDLTDEGIISVVKCCKLIQQLNVGGCIRLTDRSMRKVTEQLFFLQSLNCSGCYLLTDYAIEPLVDKCRVVMEIDQEKFPVVPSPADLSYIPTNFRKFACARVEYHELEAGKRFFVMYFGIRPGGVKSWESPLADDKYKPHLKNREGNITYVGIFHEVSIKVLNLTRCPEITQLWMERLKVIHPQIHVIGLHT